MTSIDRRHRALAMAFSLAISGTAIAGEVIRVGVRADAEPFSYKASKYDDEHLLEGYGGYMISICRRVLAQMTASGPFEGDTVKAVEIDASNRFASLGGIDEDGAPVERAVDMLCGPDSITLVRLKPFNVSHPLFLSGITFMRVRDLPRTAHCDRPVIGLLKDTTAEHEGLALLSRSGELSRFDKALDAFLAAAPGSPVTPDEREPLARALGRVIDELEGRAPEPDAGEAGRPHRGQPESIVTSECPNGYEDGPVKFLKTHDEGIEALCSGGVLYYLGQLENSDKIVR